MGEDNERVLILAGVEAELLEIPLETCASVAELAGKLEGASAAILDAARTCEPEVRPLADALAKQELWSDFPILILGGPPATELGNVTVLERPFSPQALARAVKSAVRARARQLQVHRTLEQRDRFLSVVGHELRNPLGAMVLAAELAQRSTHKADRDRTMEIIRRQAQQLAHRVDDLHDFTRLSTRRLILQREPIDLNLILRECIQYLGPGFDTDGIALDFYPSPEALLIEGDVPRLERVFGHLLRNAQRHTPRGGRVTVELFRERGTQDAIARVSDTGVGLQPAQKDSLFELYTELDLRKGMGLGLPISRGIIELHGGTIRVESEGPGRGTEVTIRLP